MLATALRMMYGYNRWATDRLLEAASRLSPEQYHAPGTEGRGSIHEGLLHVVGAQRGWLSWWDGSLPAAEAYRRQATPTEFPNLAALEALWKDVARQTDAFVERLTDEKAAEIYSFALPDGRSGGMYLWQMMLHIVNHGTQHRSEAAAQLTGFGHSPGPLDVSVYTGLKPAG
ncbi:MAG: DinB family protein [Chloroflexi bacterium]|nr:DinB family protein [Chloroflexota bacterium]